MKKLRKAKKAFTLVELVVVIAIIAVLSGVSVAVYSGITNKAKETADAEVVEQLNLKMRADAILEGNNKTAKDAFDDAAEIGFDLATMDPQAGDHYVWDQENDLFAVTKGQGDDTKIIAQDSQTSLTVYDYQRWIFTADPSNSETRSQYYTGTSAISSLTVKAGFDVGNGDISVLTYDGTGNSSKQTISIHTNSKDTTLNIKAYTSGSDSDVISHYGECGEVNILKNGDDSVHEYSNTDIVSVEEGHVVLESGSSVTNINVLPNAEVSSYNNPRVTIADGVDLPLITRDTLTSEDFTTPVNLCKIENNNDSSRIQIILKSEDGSAAVGFDAESGSVGSDLQNMAGNISNPTNVSDNLLVMKTLFSAENLKTINDSMYVANDNGVYYYNGNASEPFVEVSSSNFDTIDGYKTFQNNDSAKTDCDPEDFIVVPQFMSDYSYKIPEKIIVNEIEYSAYRFGELVVDGYVGSRSDIYSFTDGETTIEATLPITDIKVNVSKALIDHYPGDQDKTVACAFAAFGGIFTALNSIATKGSFSTTVPSDNPIKDYNFNLITLGADIQKWCQNIVSSLHAKNITAYDETLSSLANNVMVYMSDGSTTACSAMQSAMDNKVTFVLQMVTELISHSIEIIKYALQSAELTLPEGFVLDSLPLAVMIQALGNRAFNYLFNNIMKVLSDASLFATLSYYHVVDEVTKSGNIGVYFYFDVK